MSWGEALAILSSFERRGEGATSGAPAAAWQSSAGGSAPPSGPSSAASSQAAPRVAPGHGHRGRDHLDRAAHLEVKIAAKTEHPARSKVTNSLSPRAAMGLGRSP